MIALILATMVFAAAIGYRAYVVDEQRRSLNVDEKRSPADELPPVVEDKPDDLIAANEDGGLG